MSYLIEVMQIQVAARSKAWVYGRSLPDIADSNSAGGMDVARVLWICAPLSKIL
jgi:hypothetical protein